MNRFLKYFVVSSILSFILLPAVVTAFSGSGSGTEEDPYVITDWHELNEVRDDLSAYYELGNNLDEDTDGYDDYNTGEGWKPIGDSDNEFNGTFDGQNYIISDLYINRPEEDNVGLFGNTFRSPEGIVENIGLEYVNVTGDERVGGLTGYNWHYVHDSYVPKGEIKASDREAGGLLGINRLGGKVSNSYYNYDEVLVNGKNIISVGAIYEEDFDEWLNNDRYLDIEERLDKDADGYYLIQDLEDFKELLIFAQAREDFKLTTDLDLSNEPNFYIPYLEEEFDGNNHTISNLNVDLDFMRNIGLFGYTSIRGDNRGEIQFEIHRLKHDEVRYIPINLDEGEELDSGVEYQVIGNLPAVTFTC